MKTQVWVKLTALVMLVAVLAPFLPAYGQEELTYDPEAAIQRPTGVEKALTKLGRGFANILFGWAEVPVAMDRAIQTDKPLTYVLGVAPVLGLGRAVMRTSTGVFEAVTFPFSDRDVNYEPVLEPAYIF